MFLFLLSYGTFEVLNRARKLLTSLRTHQMFCHIMHLLLRMYLFHQIVQD